MTEVTQIGEEFSNALELNKARFGVELSDLESSALREYYELLLGWNARLHLVAPCSPEEFATRHVLESLLAAKHFPAQAHVVDVGSGGGLPIIPCLIARPDIHATIIDSSQKKAVFLREALRVIRAKETVEVIAERFENIPALNADIVTCRALDHFHGMFSRLVSWAPLNSKLVLFGGPSLRALIELNGLAYSEEHIPESDQRFIFVIAR